MASSDLPPTPPESADAPTGIQTSADTPAAPSIPLPPLPKPPAMSVEKFTGIRGGLDGVLVALVLAFAFLVASFPVTNSDFFRQLAIGRLLVHGEYPFGVDPFTYTSEGQYCVNHSWLFALLVYALYQIPAIGGVAVVVGKALLVVALAEIMLRVGRRVGQSLWIPAACTALALLALSPRLYLQSVCLSFLFLALTLWLLTAIGHRPSAPGQDGRQPTADSRQRKWWLIPPLFALWVNCDAWFFVGPLLVALYLVGELLQQWYPPAGEERDDSGRRRLSVLALVLVVGLAACLLNPHHFHVFTLPPELGLSPAADLVAHDAQFRPLFLSPLRQDYYDPYHGLSVAGLAYPPLLLLGLVSFVFVFGRTPGWRLPVWLGFALLSLYNVRAIPFFAIVAGPITALNWLDFAAQRLGREPLLTPGWRRWSLGGRALTILLALALLVATVPGWLEAKPHEGHRVGWGVYVNPSLEQAARQIKTWRDEGQLPANARWFNLRPEVANYLAWFAPGERAFFDQGILQFRETADDYLAIREGLERIMRDARAAAEGSEVARPVSTRKDWSSILRKRRVQFWILDQIGAQKAEQVVPWLLFGNPHQWKLCYLHGRIAIFAREASDAENSPNPSPDELKLEGVAFGPKPEQAPAKGPEVVTAPRGWWQVWWEVWWQAKPPNSLHLETARLHALRFEAMQSLFLIHHSRAWQRAIAAGTVGNALPHGPLPNCLLALNLAWSQTYADLTPAEGQQAVRPPDRQRDRVARLARQAYVRGQDAGPPESLYLAVRAARRALADNPEDSESAFQLGLTYSRLNEAMQDKPLIQASQILSDIRRTQMVAAYQNSLRCQPLPRIAARAHEALYGVFQQRYFDLAAYHLRELRNRLQATGPMPDESPEKFAQTVEAISKRLLPLEEEVKRRQDQYEVSGANKPVLEKVRIALEKGLAETALNTLDQAPPGELAGLKEISIVSQMMALFLDMGRLDKAGDLLVPDPEMADKPVPLHYLDYHVRLAAARGDYAEADRHLSDALKQIEQAPSGRPSSPQVADRVGRVLLAEAQRLAGAPRIPSVDPRIASDFWVRRWRLDAVESGLVAGQQRADWYLLRGWLALEAGRCVEARQHFQMVLDLVVPPERWIPEVNRLNALFDPREMQLLQQMSVRQNIAWALSQRYLKWLDAAQR